MFDKKEWAKKYYEDNKEKLNKYGKQWRKDNRERINKYQEEWRKKNPDSRKVNNFPLGYKHTKEAKRKISEASRNISQETREKRSNFFKGKMPKNLQYPGKFGNVKRGWYDILGKKMFFRSRWEANYALYLNFLVKHKQILKWEYEPDVFVFEAIKFGTRSYRPDFKVYNLDDSITYHEVKGFMDSKSKTKLKRMAKYYPNIKLLIIDKDVYTDIKKKLGKMLKFYE